MKILSEIFNFFNISKNNRENKKIRLLDEFNQILLECEISIADFNEICKKINILITK